MPLRRITNVIAPLPARQPGPSAVVFGLPQSDVQATPAVDHTLDVAALIARLSATLGATEAYAQLANMLVAEIDNLTRQRITAVDPTWTEVVAQIAIAVNTNCTESEIQARLAEVRDAPDGVMARYLAKQLAAVMPAAWDYPDRLQVGRAMLRRAAQVPLSDLYRSLQPPPAPSSTGGADPESQVLFSLPPLDDF